MHYLEVVNAFRYFALVPAAGHSRRMGAPKLLLPVRGRPLIEWTIEAWRQSPLERVIVVVRPDDAPLAEAARHAGAEVVVPSTPPPDMKASVQAALTHVQSNYAPADRDAFLVAPADIPRLSSAIIRRLADQHQQNPSQIVVPTLNSERGHPVLFPWPLALHVFRLGENEGLNTIVDAANPLLVACDDLIPAGNQPFADIDTPEDLNRLTQNL